MSVLEKDRIDAIGLDPLSDEVVLTISDHLDWALPKEHLVALQDKLSSYLAFFEGGELHTTYPAARGRKVVFQIVVKFPFALEGSEFVERIRPLLSKAGVSLRVMDMNQLAAARPS